MPNIFITPQPKITIIQVEVIISVFFGKTSTGSILSDSDDSLLHITLLRFWTLSVSHTKKKNLFYWIYSCPHVEQLHLLGYVWKYELFPVSTPVKKTVSNEWCEVLHSSWCQIICKLTHTSSLLLCNYVPIFSLYCCLYSGYKEQTHYYNICKGIYKPTICST